MRYIGLFIEQPKEEKPKTEEKPKVEKKPKAKTEKKE